MTQILNQSFRDWSSTRKFPFTDQSDMTCQDGRGIPMSLFTMISLCPDIEGTAEVYAIDTKGIHIRISEWTADALFDDYADGWIPIMRSGNCVGSVMTNDSDLGYLIGMAAVKPLMFTEGHLELRPEVVRGFCSSEPVLETPPSLNGYPSSDLSVEYDSSRFTMSDAGLVVDTTPDVENETPAITRLGARKTSALSFMADIAYPGNIVIRTPPWCDSQIFSSDDAVVFHQRGE